MALSDADLVRLFHDNPDLGWDTFIDQYSDLIFSIAARFSRDEDGKVDLYLHISEKLQENNLKRLKKYEIGRGGTPCKFSTWLVTVGRNLCIDWMRSRNGRKRLNEPIKKLSERDQQIFRFCYWEGFTLPEACEMMRSRHGDDIDMTAIHESVHRINRTLTSNNLWNLANDLMRMVPALSIDSGSEGSDGAPRTMELGSGTPGQDEELAARQVEAVFAEIVRELEPRSKMIIKSYYFMQIPVKEIARMMGTAEQATYRELRKITAEISKRFEEKEVTAADLPEGVRVRLEGAL